MKYTAPATNKLLLEAGFGTYISQWGYQERPGNPTKDLVRVQEQSGADLRSQRQPRRRRLRRLSDRRRQPEVPLVELADRLHLRAHVERLGQLRHRRAQHEVRLPGRVPSRRRQPVPDDQQHQLMQLTFNTHAPAVSRQPTASRIQAGAVHAQGAHRVLRVLRAGTVDEGPADAAGRAALRPRLEPVPRADDRPVASAIPTAIVLPAQAASPATTTSARASAWPTTCSATARRRSRRTSGATCIRPRTRGATSTPTRRNGCRRSPTASWTDTNGNFIPDCDILNGQPQSPTTTGSIDTCGVWSDPNFGRARPSTTLDPSILGGWGVAAVRLAVRRVGAAGADAARLGRSRLLPPVVADLHDGADVTDNMLRQRGRLHASSPSRRRATRGCRTAAATRSRTSTTSRRPASLRGAENVQTAANYFGKYTRYWDGFDITAQARLRNGLTLQGGTSTGRTVSRTSATCATQAVPASAAARWRVRPIPTAGRSSRC